MNKNSYYALKVLLLSLFVFPVILLGQSGRISGKVVDKLTGEPLFGANVFLEETNLGSSVNLMGYFTIKNVPQGDYRLIVSMMGYRKESLLLSVSPDSSICLELKLETERLESRGVIITGRKPMIEITEPAAHVYINLLEAEMSPISTITDIVATQAGVVKLKEKVYVRGGRPGEVAYLLDGCMLQDPYDHTLDVLIPEYSVRELTFYRGGFGAEYGEAQSGIIDISTMSALGKPTFRVMIMSNDLRGSAEGVQDFLDQESNKEKFNRLNFRFGGPIPQWKLPGNKISIFTAGEFRAEKGRMGGDYDSTFSVFGKFTYLLGNNTNLRFTGIFSRKSYHEYDAKWKKIHTHCPYSTQGTKHYNLVLEQNFGENALLHFQIEHHSTTVKSNVFEDGYVDINGDGLANPNPYDSIIIDPSTGDTSRYPSDIDGIDDFTDFDNDGFVEINGEESILSWEELWNYPVSSKVDSLGFYIDGYHWMRWLYRESSFYSIKANFLSRILQCHEIKTGIEFKPYKLSFYVSNEVSPYQWGGYIQDKIDLKSLKITAGLRYDYFNSNVSTGKSASQFSPRVGLSFLVTERDVVHATYSHYFQIPALQYFYINPLFDPYIGNPELGYEHTATYEMGVVHYLLSNLYIDITGYYKDITGLVGIEQLPVSLNFYYLNEDYANAKGFEVTIRKEPGGDLGYLSGIINFTYSSAVGQNSFKVRDPSQIWGDYKREFPEFPMDWDERIRINAHLILSIPEDRSLFNLNWLNNFSIGIIAEYGSGFPYTTILKQMRVVRINDGRLPSRFTLDMRLRKTFTVKNASIELFTDIQNLFNNHRLLKIADLAWYNSTGDPEGPFRDPTVWERARHIRLGLGVNF